MKDGDGERTFELGLIVTMSCHRWDSNAKFLVCLTRKPSHNPLQARVAPDGWTNYSMNPPKPKSHLFLARVYPPHYLRTLRLVSQNLRWLLRNPRRNLLVSHHFSFFTPINFSSPFLRPSPARPATPHSIIIIDDMPVGSPLHTNPGSLPVPPRTPTPPPASAKPLSFPQ
ncbi:hypothetical protein O181_046067 [Austropuccinia psidii MF-1]|uniref:Uncharacterized protein n=1 Tax=Austropuccinia psidii MF-1 TaxID=1389203 RepID=A0A9Q3HJC1_9BASI|nr:hypothetical protein [Austropuccinia psidii MF-1]